MREAFAAAGFEAPAIRLRRVVLAAIRAPADKPSSAPETNPIAAARLHEAAMNAVKQSPRNWDGARDALLKAIRADAALMWELFAPFRNQALQAALTAAAAELRRQEMLRREPGQRGAGQVDHAGRGCAARPSPISAAAINAVSGAAAASLLDTFTVNGRPIGDLTAREASQWAGARERDARFVRLLTGNLPAGDVIRKWRTGDDAARMYAIAEDMSDAA